MKLLNTALEGVYILEPRVFDDARGYFFESFSQRDFDALIQPVWGIEWQLPREAMILSKIDRSHPLLAEL